MGVQFFEIFSLVQESQQVGNANKGMQIKSRIRSVANTATGHIPLPKRLRHDKHASEEEGINSLEFQHDGESITKDHVFSVGVAFAQASTVKR